MGLIKSFSHSFFTNLLLLLLFWSHFSFAQSTYRMCPLNVKSVRMQDHGMTSSKLLWLFTCSAPWSGICSHPERKYLTRSAFRWFWLPGTYLRIHRELSPHFNFFIRNLIEFWSVQLDDITHILPLAIVRNSHNAPWYLHGPVEQILLIGVDAIFVDIG